MNAKQLGILLILAAVLGGAGWWWHAQNSAGWSGGGRSTGDVLLNKFDVNNVARIVIRRGDDHVNLVKTADRWQVQERANFPAAFSDLKALLLKLQGLKVVQSDDVGASQLSRLQLSATDTGSNAPTVIELHDASGNIIRSLLLGKKHVQKSTAADGEDWPDGRYVMTDAGSGRVLLIADALTEAEPQPANWLDKNFVKVDKAISLAATFPMATNSWLLTRTNESADWQLANAAPTEKMDSTKLSDLSQPLSNLSLADVVTTPAALENPTTLEAKTADGFDYVFHVGSKTNDNYQVSFQLSGVISTAATTTNQPAADASAETPAQKLARESSLTNWTYLVPSWTLDPVLKNRSQWLLQATNAPAR